MMMTVAQFAEKRKKKIQTVYSWIYRSQFDKHGFKLHQIGNVKLIEETKVKKK